MAGYNAINLGNQPDDGLGDGGRTGGAKINAMFDELFYTHFTKSDRWLVSRYVYDPGATNKTAFKVNDKVQGWEDVATKNRWVEGIVLDDTVSLPADIDDGEKFLLTVDVLKV